MFRQDAKQAGIFASRKDAKAQRVKNEKLACASARRSVIPRFPGFLIHPLLCAFASLREVILPVLSLLLFCGTGYAAAPAEFDAANRLFDQGDFQGARAQYQALVESGRWSANLFYNLGDATFRLGDKGAAFLAYEQALALEPGHPEAKANLRFLRAETGAKLPATPWYGRALAWPAGNEAAWFASATFFGLCFSLAPLVWSRRAATVPALFCGLALMWSGAVVAWQYSQGETWIVVADQANARTMPADNSPAVAVLPMGSHVRLRLERGPWLQVELPDDSAGWISRETVQPVHLEQRERKKF